MCWIGSTRGRVTVSQTVPGQNMLARCFIVVTGFAKLMDRLVEERCIVRGMWGVAGCALAGGNGWMDVLFREHSLVMACIAQVRRLRGQELCVLACMWIMTARTAHAYGGVHDFLVEQRSVMAVVAQVRLPGGKPCCVLVCYFMRYVWRIDGSMACGAPHGNGGMDAFAFGEFLVALKTVDLRR